MTESVTREASRQDASAASAEAGMGPIPTPTIQRELGRDEPEKPTSITALLRRLIDDVGMLFRKELAMATSEILHSVDSGKAGLASMIGGTAVLYAGLLFLMLSATIGLTEVVEGWVAALIVGGVAAVIGLIMVQVSKRKLRASSFAPRHAADSLRKDREMIGRHTR